LDFAAGEQRKPDYLKLNPKGRVPALATEHGVLTETPAILAYVAQGYPAAGLKPKHDTFAYAQAQSFNSYLCSTVHVAHAHKTRGARWTDDPAAQAALKAYVPKSMAAAFALIEDGMLQGPWVLGERYSLCDPYLFTISGWLEGDGIDLATLPRVAAHRAAMLARPAVQRVLAV
jgi:glutathione S-transferase